MIENIKKYLDFEKFLDGKQKRDSFGMIELKGDEFIDGAVPVIDRILNPGDRTIDMILEHCETHYSNPRPSLVATLKQEWNRDWCEISRYNGKTYYRIKK
ncbi:hypothetical protein [Enterococcus sp. BWR-S5]|uniref:hypothetical protein n=1 Tax=Enterococcus sp. BWR-S5 TaxID=2787714 RepID=UPI0019228D52|nr:hypothetical protein [Enterococcus sp. BWR-S5]MBL1227131.1 hypothetical protein [Enterococcus sp. BWR-S5]